MFTFSQMVDAMVSETKRPDLVSEIARYVNQTIRELHFSGDRNAVIFYEENYREATITATSETNQTWDIPDPTIFQKMAAVRYSDVFDRNGDVIWAKPTTPGRHLNQLDYFFYRAGGSFAFAGYGGINSHIDLSWYEFPKSLTFKSVAARPASFDIETGWTYADGINTDELKAAAQLLTTNWLLMRWNDVVAEGVRAKVYKRLSDTERARTCYSMYGSLRQGLWTSETAQLIGG